VKRYRNPATGTAAGFTLIELLVVTAVMAILMGIAVASLVAALDSARQGATIADMRNLGTAIEAYDVDNGYAPVSGTLDFVEVSVFLRPYYNQIVPLNDHWGHDYHFESDTKSYSLISYGKDGIDGDDLTGDTKKDHYRDIVFSNGRFPGLK
jgi:general secretion pathway protein G